MAMHGWFSRWEWAWVAVLLAGHYAFSYSATLESCTTFDEPLNLAAGVAYWKLGDYRLQPENGNLPQRWCTIPLLFMDLAYPSLEQESWRRSEAIVLGRQYLYACGNDPQAMLAAARAMAAFWSTALCLVVFLWSRTIFGIRGGLLSLGLAVFWPAVVAHGPLATSDVCGALFFTLGAWSLWEYVHRVSYGTLAAVCLSVGLAPIAKHSTVMLGPLALVYLGAIAAAGRPLVVDLGPWKSEVSGRWQRTAAGLAALLAPAAAAVLFIWASCGFRYAAAGPDCGSARLLRYLTLESCNEHAGLVGRGCALLAAWRALPEAWLYGLSYVAASARVRNAFAMGQYSISGWWWYFPLCLAVKNTLPSLALCLGGTGVAAARIVRLPVLRGDLDRVAYACLAPLGMLLVLWPAFLASHLNIGERHLLPSYPAMMVMAGAMASTVRATWVRPAACLLALLHVADVAARWPNSLAYFNQLVPRGHEYRWLVDSNLDWGQDFLRLRGWLRGHASPEEPVYLCYFGSCADAVRTPGIEELGRGPRPGEPQRLRPGLYCISATLLEAVYADPPGPWAVAFEDAYRRLRAFALGDRTDGALAGAIGGVARAERWQVGADALRDGPAREHAVASVFNALQSGRLRAYLRRRTPVADVGGSILVFRLTAADLEEALDGPPAELVPVSWMQREYGDGGAALVRAADTLFDQGRIVEAERALADAASAHPLNAKVWGRLGMVHAAAGRTDLALAAYGKACRLAADDPEPRFNRGNLLAELGRNEEAIAAYDDAVDQDPAFRDAYFNRAAVRLRMGDERRAREDLRGFVALGGTLPESLLPLVEPPPPDGSMP